MIPIFTLEKIKFGTDPQTFEKAVILYESGKVTKFRVLPDGFSAVVSGTEPYEVFVDGRHYDRGACNCYLGKKDVLCKHMVAVAICSLFGGEKLKEEDKKIVDGAACSGKRGELKKEEHAKIKKDISAAMKYIKAYRGPSRTYFAYQNSLEEGCARLSAVVFELPVSRQTAGLLVDMLLRLDEKLCRGGVDDSDGVDGGFIEEAVEVLKEFAKIDPNSVAAFTALENKETCFGWEEPLVALLRRNTVSSYQ